MQGSPRIDELRQKFHENPRRYFAPLANEYRKAGDPEQAIAICRAHLAQQPGHMSGHVVYGQALYDAKRPDEARVVFEKALSLDPDNAIVLRQLGDIAREKGDNSEAKHWYSRALDADPGDTEVAAYIAELTEPVSEETAPETGMPSETPVPGSPVETPVPGSPVETPVPGSPVSDAPEADDRSPVLPSEAEAPVAAKGAPETDLPDTDQPDAGLPGTGVSTGLPGTGATTPAHEDSPFVTRTMAELYAKQGYRAAALDVYRQLALHHPDDREIMDRIEELSHEPEQAERAPAEPAPAEPAPAEPAPAEESHTFLTDLAAEDFAFQELDNEIAFAPTDEDLNLVSEERPAEEPPKNAEPEKHFTELDLAGDSWDTDSWAAGFTANERVDIEFDALDEARDEVPDEVLAPEPLVSSAEAEAVEIPSPEPEPVPAPEKETEQQVEAEAEAEAEPIVAYSPELPEKEELPHYAPKGPTVREFFATLGSKRPPSSRPITARAAVPEIRNASSRDTNTEDLPLATDAFADMFANEPVSEDDARAAFALSGALTASETPASKLPTPPKPVPAQEAVPPAVPTATEESEEDIRRFREWLDGLSES